MRSVLAAATLLLGGVLVSAQALAGLRVVVIEGENAVNIIQQKTAVRALVEVRDRNNLPVSGASATFSVTGNGGGAVTGAQTLTVSTNAAGQASLTGVTPASSGGLQISVNASYQGLKAATTITQTVVATAAAAGAAAAAVAATTGAAATGGGISTGAILGIVGGVGAIGGGAAVLGGGGGGSDDTSSNQTNTPATGTTTTVTPPPTSLPTCVFATSPTTVTVPIEGSTFGVTVTMTPSTCAEPRWIVTNVPSFVSVDRMEGTGNGGVTIVVSAFTPAANFPARSGAVSVAGTVVHILQPRAPTLLRP